MRGAIKLRIAISTDKRLINQRDWCLLNQIIWIIRRWEILYRGLMSKYCHTALILKPRFSQMVWRVADLDIATYCSSVPFIVWSGSKQTGSLKKPVDSNKTTALSTSQLILITQIILFFLTHHQPTESLFILNNIWTVLGKVTYITYNIT